MLAFWCYQNCLGDDSVDDIVLDIYAEIDDYWPPERTIVDHEYPRLETPFDDLTVPNYAIEADWSADNLLDYMRTWSASRRYLAANQADPVSKFEDQMRQAWGREARTVTWPIVVRVGRKGER